MTLIADVHMDSASAWGEDHAHAALAFVQKLLQDQTSRDQPLADLLHELSDVFAAREAGLAASPPDAPIVQQHANVNGNSRLPWYDDATLWTRVRTSASAQVVEAEGGTWLLTAVWLPHGEPGLLWLDGTPTRFWTPGEQAAFSLAGLALGRLLSLRGGWLRADERAALQRRMEHLALVTGRLAHDFGNLLTGILGFAELSLSQMPADSPSRRYMSEVLQVAQHGADWVRKLQTFSRRRRAKGTASLLNKIVAEEAERCREAWGSAITFLVAPADAVPSVAVDDDALREMLRQLLDNAREAIEDRGVVAVSARTVDLGESDCVELVGNANPGRHVEVTITDTGSGLSPETRRRLFADVFFSTKNRQRGLGLAVVYAYLSSHHGGLRFGPHPEEGTAVRVYLPVAGADSATIDICFQRDHP